MVEKGSFPPLAGCPAVMSLRTKNKACVGDDFAAYEHAARVSLFEYIVWFFQFLDRCAD
jgi:hypothetical protein